jgi:putative hydrolase of the HAD superfamily
LGSTGIKAQFYVSNYEAVVFDFGGVVTTSPFDAFNAMEAQRGLPHDFVRRVNSVNPDSNAWARFERAEIDAAEFDARFGAEAKALGQTLDGASVIACLSGDVRPRMVAAMDALLAAGFRLGCITNNVPAGSGPGMAHGAGKAAAVSAAMARFEHIIESSKVELRKPDPRIYLMMCDALAVAPEACIYLDDLGINCKPAAALGMHAIKVSSEDQALTALSQVLGMTFV